MKQFWLDTSKMADGELADVIHELTNELEERMQAIAGYLVNLMPPA